MSEVTARNKNGNHREFMLTKPIQRNATLHTKSWNGKQIQYLLHRIRFILAFEIESSTLENRGSINWRKEK